MLRLIPGVKVSFLEKCSGHGGSFGVMKETFPTGMKVGNNVFNRVKKEFEKDNGN